MNQNYQFEFCIDMELESIEKKTYINFLKLNN